MKPEPPPIWHELCVDAGLNRQCRTCSRNPDKHPDADPNHPKRRPMVRYDGRCADWLQERGTPK